MDINNSLPFPVNPDVVTFESKKSLEKDDIEIPHIEVGYKNRIVAGLYQYLNKKPSPENIQYGQWFAMPHGTFIEKEILAIEPAGQSLEDLKEVVKTILSSR